MNKHYPGILSAMMLFFAATALWANDQTIVLGREDNWMSVTRAHGLIMRAGRGGFFELALKDSEYPAGGTTDLLLHLNRTPVADESSHYSTKSASVAFNENYAKFGEGCGVFQNGAGITLIPRSGALFSPKTTWSDFSIEFWLYPASFGEGEIIFSWKGFRFYQGRLVAQRIECRVEKRALVWQFENFFGATNDKPFAFTMTGIDRLIPREWHHHLLRFESKAGFLEYLIDGNPVGTRYATPSGRDEPEFYLPYVGEAENTALEIGNRFTGFMDEFRISREFVETPVLGKYRQAFGRAITRVFDLGYSGTVLKRVDAKLEKPGDSEINFYIRCSDAFNTLDDLKENWIPFSPGTGFQGRLRGRYVQIMIEFFPDGRNEATPRLFEVDLVFEPDLPPVGPSGLTAVAGNGKVTLSWERVNQDDVRGYYLFYGEAPLHYLGADAREGSSPIDVGNVTTFELTGLTNGRLYYFAVAAYDSSNPPHLSDFIEEKSARPSEVLR